MKKKQTIASRYAKALSALSSSSPSSESEAYTSPSFPPRSSDHPIPPSPMNPAAPLQFPSSLPPPPNDAPNPPSLLRELQDFSSLIHSHPELRDLFSSPIYAAAQRLSVLQTLAERVRLSTPALHFLRFLIEKKRASLLPAILDEFQRLLDRASKRLHIDVSSPHPLPESFLQRLQSKITQDTQHSALLHTHTDPDLLAGLVVQIEDRVFDGSLRSRLDQMKRHLQKQIA